jgi:hypothetical protein
MQSLILDVFFGFENNSKNATLVKVFRLLSDVLEKNN